MQDIADGLVTLSRTYQTLAKSLDDLRSLQRKELEALAYRFGLNPAPQTSATDLVALLELKAQDARTYQLQIAGINESVAALHNLKRAAQDAAARLDFAEVESLLSRVDEVETEAAAQTKELRAANALLQGRVDDAYRLYAAAADSFASIGTLEPASRRDVHAQALYAHGLRYGGPGLSHAITLWSRNLIEFPKAADQTSWAATQNRISKALRYLAARVADAGRAVLLEQSISACEDALTVFTELNYPPEWAATQDNLGAALHDLAIRNSGSEQIDLFSRAETAYRHATSVFTEVDYPSEWVRIRINLALTLRFKAERLDREERAKLLFEVITTYRSAVTVYDRIGHKEDWALIQHNLANALRALAETIDGAAGGKLLEEASVACQEALTVYTKLDHPLNWADTHINWAIVEIVTARHGSTADPRPHLKAALVQIDTALTVFEPIHTAQKYARARELRDFATDALSRLNP